MEYHDDQRPVLLYDSDSDLCCYWVRYWQRLIGPGVRYEQHSDVAPELLTAAIQWIHPNGTRFSGAHAVFRLLACAPQSRHWLWLYEHVPGFARIAEGFGGIISRHPHAAATTSRWLWGRERWPDDYGLVTWVFLRIVALIYLAAFASLAVQIRGLFGADGILSVGDYLDQAHEELGSAALWQIPTVFWFGASDAALQGVCLLGMAGAASVLFNFFVRTGLLLCYGLYLSLLYAGQVFLSFQWDLFLLESGFLALFLTGGSRIVIWLYRWLLFRFMFMGGVVKLASGDPSWRNLSALKYHFETQPLPSPLAWYGHQLPDQLLQVATASVFIIELVVPFFVFMPRRLRLLAAASFLVLQGTIILTGSYNFFNILTLALCVFLLEDRDLRPLLGTRLSTRLSANTPAPGVLATASAMMMAVITLSVCGALLWLTNVHQRPIQPFDALVRFTATLGIVNGYGPFAVMTTERREIIIEGSNDERTWLAYEFEYKPGDLSKPLSWNIPHQPRLDWQMWFQALGDAQRNPWFLKFMARLHHGSETVQSLLLHNPFSEHPPRYLRATLYRYVFATPDIRSSTGQTWQREFLSVYVPSRSKDP